MQPWVCSVSSLNVTRTDAILIELYDDEETQGFTLLGLLSVFSLSLSSLRHLYLMSVLVVPCKQWSMADNTFCSISCI
jgi:hypothetical protein